MLGLISDETVCYRKIGWICDGTSEIDRDYRTPSVMGYGLPSLLWAINVCVRGSDGCVCKGSGVEESQCNCMTKYIKNRDGVCYVTGDITFHPNTGLLCVCTCFLLKSILLITDKNRTKRYSKRNKIESLSRRIECVNRKTDKKANTHHGMQRRERKRWSDGWYDWKDRTSYGCFLLFISSYSLRRLSTEQRFNFSLLLSLTSFLLSQQTKQP